MTFLGLLETQLMLTQVFHSHKHSYSLTSLLLDRLVRK